MCSPGHGSEERQGFGEEERLAAVIVFQERLRLPLQQETRRPSQDRDNKIWQFDIHSRLFRDLAVSRMAGQDFLAVVGGANRP